MEHKPARREMPARASRGQRMHALLGEAAAADEEFWNQGAFKEHENDSDFTTSDESEEEDVVDSDFDISEGGSQEEQDGNTHDDQTGGKNKRAKVEPTLKGKKTLEQIEKDNDKALRKEELEQHKKTKKNVYKDPALAKKATPVAAAAQVAASPPSTAATAAKRAGGRPAIAPELPQPVPLERPKIIDASLVASAPSPIQPLATTKKTAPASSHALASAPLQTPGSVPAAPAQPGAIPAATGIKIEPQRAVVKKTLRETTKIASSRSERSRHERSKVASEKRRIMQERKSQTEPAKVLSQQELLEEAKKTALKSKQELVELLRFEEDLKTSSMKKENPKVPVLRYISTPTEQSISFLHLQDAHGHPRKDRDKEKKPNELEVDAEVPAAASKTKEGRESTKKLNQILPPSYRLNSDAPIVKPKECAVTGKPARYFDPMTKQPYHDMESFAVLRKRMREKESPIEHIQS